MSSITHTAITPCYTSADNYIYWDKQLKNSDEFVEHVLNENSQNLEITDENINRLLKICDTLFKDYHCLDFKMEVNAKLLEKILEIFLPEVGNKFASFVYELADPDQFMNFLIYCESLYDKNIILFKFQNHIGVENFNDIKLICDLFYKNCTLSIEDRYVKSIPQGSYNPKSPAFLFTLNFIEENLKHYYSLINLIFQKCFEAKKENLTLLDSKYEKLIQEKNKFIADYDYNTFLSKRII